MKTDISQLPAAKRKSVPASKGDGWAPDENPWLCRLIVDRMNTDTDRPQAADTPFRHSNAGRCSRMLALRAAGVEPRPEEPTDRWNADVGTVIHDHIQRMLGDKGLMHETPNSYADLTSGHSDTLFEIDGDVVLVDYKTTGGWGYKAMTTTLGGPPEGPKYGHVAQLGLNILGLEEQDIHVDKAILVYISKEMVGKDKAGAIIGDPKVGQLLAQFTIHEDQWRPVVNAEIARMTAVLDELEQGHISPAYLVDWDIPAGAVIHAQSGGGRKGNFGRWSLTRDAKVEAMGDTWECAYCSYSDTCERLGSPHEATPVNLLPGKERS
jgi:CRISPR/Cas system-associated exonuclease Cas4 (RecB family)